MIVVIFPESTHPSSFACDHVHRASTAIPPTYTGSVVGIPVEMRRPVRAGPYVKALVDTSRTFVETLADRCSELIG